MKKTIEEENQPENWNIIKLIVIFLFNQNKFTYNGVGSKDSWRNQNR